MTKRLLALEIALLVGLSAVFLVPKTDKLQEPGIIVALPDFIGPWYGTDQAVSKGEREILGPDTQFVRKLYTNGQGDQIYVSIVLSGPDMNTSIHRPERCLPAQGWTVIDSQTVVIPTANAPLGTTRLHGMRILREEAGEKPLTVYNLTYYWFVAQSETTPSHLRRTLIDIRDRLFKGFNQRWAYLTVAAPITEGLTPFGRSEKETDIEVEAFIRKLVPLLAKPLPSRLRENRTSYGSPFEDSQHL